MPVNVFISYSHKDRKYFEDLCSHLASLKDTGKISEWHDRMIPPGGLIDQKINEHLISSHIIIHLISADFLESKYCMHVEAKKAKERADKKESILIPVIVRPCYWKTVDFFKNRNALPRDAKPIVDWPTNDAGWTDVVTQISDYIELISVQGNQAIHQPCLCSVDILSDVPSNSQLDKISITSSNTDIYENTKLFTQYLNDTDLKLSHHNANEVHLDDIFVWPDLISVERNLERVTNFCSSKDIIDGDGNIIILGDEQSGKTSLIKNYYRLFTIKGYVPILIDGDKIKTSDVDKLLESAILSQYVSGSRNIDNKINYIALIDDFDEVQLRPSYKEILLESLIKKVKRIIILRLSLP